MNPTNNQPLSGQDVIHVFWRHRRAAALFFVTTMVLAATYVVLAPRVYVSKAKLFVRVGRENVGLDPSVRTLEADQMVNIYSTRESEIISIVDMLRNRFLMEKVVDRLGPEQVLCIARPASDNGSSSGSDAIGKDSDGEDNVAIDAKQARLLPSSRMLLGLVGETHRWMGGIELGQRESAIIEMQEHVKIDCRPGSNVIEISYRSTSPELSQRTVATLVDVFLEEHPRWNRTEGSHEFFEQQTVLLKAELDVRIASLCKAKDAMGVTSIDSGRNQLTSSAEAVDEAFFRTQSELAESAARIASLRAAIDRMGDQTVVTHQTDGLAQLATDGMRQELYKLELRELELLSRYQDRHTAVVAVQQQIAAARKILNEQEDDRTHVTTAPDPIGEELDQQLALEIPVHAGLEGKLRVLTDQRNFLGEKRAAFNKHTGIVQGLEWEVELLKKSHLTYMETFEQARVDEELSSNRLSNINIVEPATFVPKPDSPRIGIVAALGIVIASFGGFGLAFVRERFDPSITDAS